jgi:hypothetical protein
VHYFRIPIVVVSEKSGQEQGGLEKSGRLGLGMG